MDRNESSNARVSGFLLADALSHSASADRRRLEDRYAEFIRSPELAMANMTEFRRVSDAMGKTPQDVRDEVEAVETFNRLDVLHADQHVWEKESDEANIAYEQAEAKYKQIVDAAEFERVSAFSRKNEANQKASAVLYSTNRLRELSTLYPHLKLTASPLKGSYVNRHRPNQLGAKPTGY